MLDGDGLVHVHWDVDDLGGRLGLHTCLLDDPLGNAATAQPGYSPPPTWDVEQYAGRWGSGWDLA